MNNTHHIQMMRLANAQRGSAPQPPTFDFQPGMAAYWKLANNALDSSGNGNHGTAQAGLVFNGEYAEFGSKYIDVPDSDDLSFTDGTNDLPIHIALTFIWNDKTGVQYWISKRGFTDDIEWYAASTDTDVIFVLANPNNLSDNIRITIPIESILKDVINTIQYGYDGNKLHTGINAYLNGYNPIGTTSLNGVYTGQVNGNNFVRIGSYSNADPFLYPFKSGVKEISIWKNRTMTPEEIAEIDRRGKISEPLIPIPEPPTGFRQETIDYMNVVGIDNDTIKYYEGTPEERTGEQLWNYVDEFVSTLIDNGLWTGSVIYPFLGGTSGKCSVQLTDPSNVITWGGDWVFNQFGAKGNGTNTYGDTGVSVTSKFDRDSIYLTTVIGSDNVENNKPYFMGSQTTTNFRTHLTSNQDLNIIEGINGTNTFSESVDSIEGIYSLGKRDVKHVININGKFVNSFSTTGPGLSGYPLIIGTYGTTSPNLNYCTTQELRLSAATRAFSQLETSIFHKAIDTLYTNLGTKTWGEVVLRKEPSYDFIFNANTSTNNQGLATGDNKIFVSYDRGSTGTGIDVRNLDGTLIKNFTVNAGHGNDMGYNETTGTLWIPQGGANNLWSEVDIATESIIRTIDKKYSGVNEGNGNIAIDNAKNTFWTSNNLLNSGNDIYVQEWDFDTGMPITGTEIAFSDGGITDVTQGSFFYDGKLYLFRGGSTTNGIIIIDTITKKHEIIELNKASEAEGMTYLIDGGELKIIVGFRDSSVNYVTFE